MYDNEKNTDDYLEKFDSSTPIWERKTSKRFNLITLILLIIYLAVFFRPGVFANVRENNRGVDVYISFSSKGSYIIGGDEFWNKSIFSSDITYTRKAYKIEVKGEKDNDRNAELKLYYKDKILDTRIITFLDENHWNKGIKDIIDGDLPSNFQKKVDYEGLEGFILGEYNTFKGDLGLLGFALIFLGGGWLGLKCPLFLFYCRHAISVEDPEPTQTYMVMNFISSIVCLIIAVACATKSINLGIFDFMFEMFRF